MLLPKNTGELTIRQFQEVNKILSKQLDEGDILGFMDREIELLCYISGKSKEEIEKLDHKVTVKFLKELAFLHQDYAPETWAKRIYVNGRFYMPVPDNEFKTGALVTLKFLEERKQPIELLNQMLACLYVDMNWLGKPKKYKAENHDRVAKDMLDVKLKDVYGFLLFKKKVFEALKATMEIYLNEALVTIKEAMTEAEQSMSS